MDAALDSAGAGRLVVVYDGACSFCRGQVAGIQRRDRRDQFEYLTRQTAGLEDRFPKLTEGDFNTGMRLIHSDGSIDVGADAAYQIARRLPGWRRIAWLYRLPLLNPIARGAYALVAKYRYKLAARCDDGVCKAP